MIGIVGGGLAAAKLVEGYREAGGEDEIADLVAGPSRPRTTARRSRSGCSAARPRPPTRSSHPVEWYAEHDVDLRLGETIGSLDDVDADTIVLATGARPRAARRRDRRSARSTTRSRCARPRRTPRRPS